MVRKNAIPLYGNVGANPETRTIPARTAHRDVYDVLLDKVVTEEVAVPERELRTFSIAVNQRTEENETVTRWIRCDDWDGHSKLVSTGDRVKVLGYFKERRYEKDGEMKTVRTFTVQSLQTVRLARTRVKPKDEASPTIEAALAAAEEEFPVPETPAPRRGSTRRRNAHGAEPAILDPAVEP